MTKTVKRPAKKRPAPRRGPVVKAATVEELNAVIAEMEKLKTRVASLERAELARAAGPAVRDSLSPQIPWNG